MPSPLDKAVSVPFRLIAAARGARAVHPQGFLCRGTWTVDRTSPIAPDAEVLKAGARYDCLVRMSRGAGFPEQIGDFFGVAVRMLDAYGPGRHQDLLINSSADVPLLHHVFLPAPRWYSQSYSTCLPYRAGAGLFVIGLQPPDEQGPGPSLDAMRDAVRRDQVGYTVSVAAPLGRWEAIGSLLLRDPIDPGEGDVDFDPLHADGGLEPATWLNKIRREAYKQSRKGRGAPTAPRKTPA